MKNVKVPIGKTLPIIWGRIVDTQCKPRPRKNVLVEAIDEISKVAGNKSVNEIVNEVVYGEVFFRQIIKNLNPASKELVYDSLTVRKKVLFPHLISAHSKLTEIGKIYSAQRFIMEHGLPPYEVGKINMPDKKMLSYKLLSDPKKISCINVRIVDICLQTSVKRWALTSYV